MSVPSGLFIIGTQRSGSNLLRVMLNQAAEVAAPHPPHLLQTFFPLLPLYGDLYQTGPWQSLVTDVCAWVNANPVPWAGFIASPDRLFLLEKRSLPALVGSVYDQFAVHTGKSIWVNKSMANVRYLPDIQADLPLAKFLYLYRDGRDVALSFQKAVVGPKHPYVTGREWAHDQRLALEGMACLPADQALALSYEQLISAPEPSVRQVCQFLGIEFRPALLDYHQSAESVVTASSGKMWANLTRPVMAGNQGKFLREMAPEAISQFEAAAGDVLVRLGYTCVGQGLPGNHSFSAEDIAAFEAEDMRLRQLARQNQDPADAAKRLPQEVLLKEIIQRLKGSPGQ